MARYEVRINGSPLRIEAESDDDARFETIAALAEDPSLLSVTRMPSEDELPTVEEVQGLMRTAGPEDKA